MIMRALLLSLFALSLLSACASSPQLGYQYTTLKLIERDHITSTEVTAKAERIGQIIDSVDSLTLRDLDVRVKSILGYDRMLASDRLLVGALLGDTTYGLDIGIDTPLTDEHRAHLAQRLEWVVQAAALAD